MVASTAMSAMGSIMQGQQAEAMGRAQQAAYNQQAENDRKAAAFESAREFDKQQKGQSAALVAVSGSGVTLEGSPTEALVENAKQGELDIQAIQYGSKLRQGQLKTQGELAKYKGEQAQSASYLSAAGNVFSGLSSLYKPSRSFSVGGSANPFASMY